MTDPRRTCSTCVYWRAGASPVMMHDAPDDSADTMGACENIAPQVFIIDGGPFTLQPTTHATRCCGDWTAEWLGDDPDGPGDGEPHPKPEVDPGRVHRLFLTKPAPIAA